MNKETIPVGEMRDEMARRRILRMIKEMKGLVADLDTAQADVTGIAATLTGIEVWINSAQTSLTNLQTGNSSAQASISGLQTAMAGKQNTITPANPIADANTGLSITLLTQLVVSLNGTNSKLNQVLAALRQTGIIRT